METRFKKIALDYMIGGHVMVYDENKKLVDGGACPTIESQVVDILNKNKNYKYVDLIYKGDNMSNLEEATLIVEIIKL